MFKNWKLSSGFSALVSPGCGPPGYCSNLPLTLPTRVNMPFAKGSENVSAIKGKKGRSVVWKWYSSAVWRWRANHQTCSKVCLRAMSTEDSWRLFVSILKKIFEILYFVVFCSFTKNHNWNQRGGFQRRQTKKMLTMILFLTSPSPMRTTVVGRPGDNNWENILV